MERSASYQNNRASAFDPPDVLAETMHGALVGFELRELVDQEAIELNERGKEVYRDWTTSEVIQELQKIIQEKDTKKYIGGPYEKLILVIPTAEPVLTHWQLKPVLDTYEFNQTNQLQKAYLLFQYDPAIKSYPYIKLRLSANTRLDPTGNNAGTIWQSALPWRVSQHVRFNEREIFQCASKQLHPLG